MKKNYVLNLLLCACIILTFLILFSLRAKAAIHMVSVADFTFSPPSMNVNVGDTVQWMWASGTHTTTSTSIPSGAPSWNSNINSVTTFFSYIVTQPGIYNYVCTIHPGMSGSFTASLVGISENTGVSAFNWFFSDTRQITISLNLPKPAALNIRLYDIVGSEATILASLPNVHGTYKSTFSLALIAKGVYLLEVSADQKKTVQRIIVE
jgi:plastocyanin